MNYSGAVFFDYDGTLTDEEKGIYQPTKLTVKAIEGLREKGFFVCLATGRAKCYSAKTGIEFDGAITSNGGYAEIGGECIHNQPIKKELLLSAIDYFEQNGIYYSGETPNCCYARDKYEVSFRAMLDNFKIPLNIFYPMEKAFENGDVGNILKMLITYENDSAFEQIKSVFDGELIFDKHRFFDSADICEKGVTKALGVEAVLKKINVPIENTYAFGDGTNDITMFKAVKHPVAMGISNETVKEASEYVTGSVSEDGIYGALKEFGILDF